MLPNRVFYLELRRTIIIINQVLLTKSVVDGRNLRLITTYQVSGVEKTALSQLMILIYLYHMLEKMN